MKQIVVEGMRGKSEVVALMDYYLAKRNYNVLSKVTGLNPIISSNGIKKFVNRKGGFLIDHENRRCLKLAKGKDFIVFENQGISPYTMKLFNNILKPDVILIPNVRLEHQESLGETIEEIANSFAMHFDVPKLIITTEQKESVLKIFRHYAKRYNKELISVKCEEEIPSINNIHLVNEALKRITGFGLSENDLEEHREKLLRRFSIKTSRNGIKYFISSKINDVGSSLAAYKFLSRQHPDEKLCYVAYFRSDRKDRAMSFIHFFNAIGKNNNISRIFLRGDFCEYVYGKLAASIKQKTNIIEKARIKDVMDYCRKTDSVLVTSVNGVNGFMRKLEKNLEA